MMTVDMALFHAVLQNPCSELQLLFMPVHPLCGGVWQRRRHLQLPSIHLLCHATPAHPPGHGDPGTHVLSIAISSREGLSVCI